MYDAVIVSDLHLGSSNCQAKRLGAFLDQMAGGGMQTARLILRTWPARRARETRLVEKAGNGAGDL